MPNLGSYTHSHGGITAVTLINNDGSDLNVNTHTLGGDTAVTGPGEDGADAAEGGLSNSMGGISSLPGNIRTIIFSRNHL